MPKIHTGALAALLVVAFVPAGCVSPAPAANLDAPSSFVGLEATVLAEPPQLATFAADGPFAYDEREDVELALPDGHAVVGDVLLPHAVGPVPLVILSHGNQSRKEAHRYQARRLASFGFATLVLQLPNHDLWLRNGQTIARVAQLLHDEPGTLGRPIDPGNIVLAGHSFGGSAVAIAAGRGAPVKGLVLLDPAVVSDRVEPYLRKVTVPVLLLGSDRGVFRARRQRLFYKEVAGEIGVVRVSGATHDDAQSPSMYSLSAFGFDPYTSREHQATFTAALTAAAFSIAATGHLDFAWRAYAGPLAAKVLKGPRRRQATASR